MADGPAAISVEEFQALSQRIGVLEDKDAILKLQYAYGYYLDKCLYEEVVDLYAEDGRVVFAGGIYKGKAGLRRLYLERFRKSFTGGYNGPIHGFLLDHQLLQPIIDVAPDRQTAKGRFRIFMQAGSHVSRDGPPPAGLQQWWEGGLYENTYVKEDGVWKIGVLDYHLIFHATYEHGWAHWKPIAWNAGKTYPEDPAGPDELVTDRETWPNTPVVPFHYAHPVTGKPWEGEREPSRSIRR